MARVLRAAVVIPTRGQKPARLAAALRSLAAQELRRDELEVVVVGEPGLSRQGVSTPPGLEVRVLEAPGATSAAAKRNVGWRATRAPLVAFTDDDCRADRRWLATLLGAAGGAADVFLQGRTEPDPDERRELWGLVHTQTIVGDSPWHEACNIAYPRRLLERLEGFDESFADYGGEDTDLGLRALAAGATKAYVDDGVVWHAVERRRLSQWLRLRTSWRDFGLLFSRHPEQRRHLYWRVFLRPEHARVLLYVAGVLTRRPLLAAAAGIPYIELHLRNYRLSPLSVLRAGLQLP
jgi:GT2 family glycosyltransferase